jgi:hypothetical protein
MEPSVIPYTKETIENFMAKYGRGWANFAKMIHCLCIFTMPIIGMSPLTIFPLLGLVIALMVIFYTKLSYRHVIYIPEVFLFVSATLYLTCKIKTVSLYFTAVKDFVDFICTQSDTKETVASSHLGRS